MVKTLRRVAIRLSTRINRLGDSFQCTNIGYHGMLAVKLVLPSYYTEFVS